MPAIASATRRRPIAAIAVMLVLAVDSSCHGSTAPTGVGGRSFNHIVMVVEENTDYTSVIGSSSMPYLNGLAQQYGLATQYYANTHPSIGNYFMMTVGTIITNDDSYGSVVTDDNVIRQLLAAGKTWKAYAEDLPSRSEEHTSELQSLAYLVCRLLLEKKKKTT